MATSTPPGVEAQHTMPYELRHPTESDTGACLQWLPWRPEEEETPAITRFMQTGYQAHVIRLAELQGPALIARLVTAGLLLPESDPVEALEDLIARVESP